MQMRNPTLVERIEMLRSAAKQHDAPIWSRVAELLARPRGRRAEVNVSKIARYSSAGGVVVVPGKVLGSGGIEHPVTVAAFSFSSIAMKKILDAKGRVLSIDELVRINPKGTGVRIIV
ncbi:MAG: 50S ribosomal protein L18e [Candidatus Nitrosocaldus sp.]|nr:50S ribosomal protein L18e [Candidatus Nitrosocaldus sp.]MDW8275780.1 50S ribosomal protein L18e [Candidatus Nitrosocaldus sp.]